MNFKSINWALVLVIFAVVIVGGVISQLIVSEEDKDGKTIRKLSIGGDKKSGE